MGSFGISLASDISVAVEPEEPRVGAGVAVGLPLGALLAAVVELGAIDTSTGLVLLLLPQATNIEPSIMTATTRKRIRFLFMMWRPPSK